MFKALKIKNHILYMLHVCYNSKQVALHYTSSFPH